MLFSMIPLLILICSVIPYTPITEESVIDLISELIPSTFIPYAKSLIADVYNRSAAVVSISALVVLFSAGKGMLAIYRGINAIHGITELPNFLVIRLRAVVYTLIMILMVLISLIISVFGDKIMWFLQSKLPYFETFTPFFSHVQRIVIFVVLVLFFTLLFTFVPKCKVAWRTQVVGAVFVAASWTVFSYVFSIYVNYFNGATIYGSMTMLILLMLWFYFVFYLLFLGALLSEFLSPATNVILQQRELHKEERVSEKAKNHPCED
ncbi:MAG: YihY/virulence factor BrkB family protein, partial [Lachnospiraceae bacterium]|nr:YihY/virulence factor BrkB family protein [Lachnospiraceae bacterium]